MKAYLFSLVLILSAEAFSAVILIDPGHGGEDIGAKGNHALEKTLTLQIAKRIHDKLEKKHVAYLSRSFDRTLSLMERAELAEKVKADLFISVHINSAVDKKSIGFETYYLDNHNHAANKKIESVENASLEGEDKIINQILIDLVISKTVKQSKKLAQMVHSRIRNSVAKNFPMSDRGAKPGLFYVLALSKRPGILLEAGFISNSKEAKMLTNPGFQESYADAVAMAVENYLRSENPVIPK